MQVVAFTSPSDPRWRWRIVNYDGGMVEESYETFASIATAVTDGSRRLNEMNGDDVTDRYSTRMRSR